MRHAGGEAKIGVGGNGGGDAHRSSDRGRKQGTPDAPQLRRPAPDRVRASVHASITISIVD